MQFTGYTKEQLRTKIEQALLSKSSIDSIVNNAIELTTIIVKECDSYSVELYTKLMNLVQSGGKDKGIEFVAIDLLLSAKECCGYVANIWFSALEKQIKSTVSHRTRQDTFVKSVLAFANCSNTNESNFKLWFGGVVEQSSTANSIKLGVDFTSPTGTQIDRIDWIVQKEQDYNNSVGETVSIENITGGDAYLITAALTMSDGKIFSLRGRYDKGDSINNTTDLKIFPFPKLTEQQGNVLIESNSLVLSFNSSIHNHAIDYNSTGVIDIDTSSENDTNTDILGRSAYYVHTAQYSLAKAKYDALFCEFLIE